MAGIVQDAELIGFDPNHNIGLPEGQVSVTATPFLQFDYHDRFISAGFRPNSKHLYAVSRDQNINLPERFLQTFFEVFEELLCDPIARSDDLDLHDCIDILNTTILPPPLIWRRQSAHGDRTKVAANSSQIPVIFVDSIRSPLL